MDFDLTDQQRLIGETARKLGEQFGLDYWTERDRKHEFPREFWNAVCEAGLSGTMVAEEFGGSGLGMSEMAVIIENLAATGGGATIGQLFMIGPIFGGLAIQRFGSEKMKLEQLPKIAKGQIVSMALTEPNAGSNSLQISSCATPDGTGWRISGNKIWITGMDSAEKVLVVARTMNSSETATRTRGLSLFLIDVDSKGLSYSPIEKCGTNTLSSSTVYFDGVRAGRDDLVGTLHGGWRHLVEVLNPERIATTAGLVGCGELAIKLGVDYANNRTVFDGRPISAYQGLQFPLAQAFVDLESARLMNYKAAWLYDNNRPNGRECNVGKLIAARAAELATDRAMQMMGGMGYARDSHVERLWRDARLFRIAPISEEMIFNFIATRDLGMPRSY
jgi:acyl-CoA dehydrogenase